jgi:hypothetical protein
MDVIQWVQPDERHSGREDACWYIYQSNSDLVCRVSRHGDAVQVRADGEMRINVLDENNEIVGVIRYGDQFREYGINNDNDLGNFVFGEEDHLPSQGGKVRFEVIDSPWFDLYDGKSGDHLDRVHDTLTGAVNAAWNHLEIINLYGKGKDND